MDIKDLLPIPDIEKSRKILCIQPHPDDNETGAGGTIAKLAGNGSHITYLTITDGRMGTADPSVSAGELIAVRRREAERSAAILGVKELLFWDYADASYIDEKELAKRIVSVVREIQPEIVMSVDPFLPYEAHPDHRKVGMAAAEACLFSAFPHFYSYGEISPSKTCGVSALAFYNTAYPNTFINVDSTWELKIQSIAAHESQFNGEMLGLYKMYFEYKSMQLAGKRGFKHAEAFKVLTPMHLHANVDALNW